MTLQRETRPVHSRPWHTPAIGPAALLLTGLFAAACDLTPVPVQQAGTAGQTNVGPSSAGMAPVGNAGSPATGSGGTAGGGTDAAGSDGAVAGGGAAAGGTAGASNGGGAPSGSGGAPSGSGGGAPLTNNLIQNGDFSQADSMWHVQAYAGNETHSVMDGAFCVVLSQNASITIGWPADPASGFPIVDGSSYAFSYQVSVTGSPTNLTFGANVGPSNKTGTFTTVAATGDVPGSTLQTFQHPFTAMGATTSAGVAFNVQANGSATVCVDNVSVTKN